MGVFLTLRYFFSKKDHKTKKNSYPESSLENNKSNDSSVTNSDASSGSSFRFEGGRRYHADIEVSYFLPNDDDESDRVHLQHWILRYALQDNFTSPVQKELSKGINVLDSGCGPGTWTNEMAHNYPQSNFYGIDASSVFPTHNVPKNIIFFIGNVAKNIPYRDNFFGFIHQRLLVFGLTDQDWTNALSHFFRILKPGGYIELAEPNIQEMFTSGPAMNLLQVTSTNMMSTRNIPLTIAAELEKRLLRAGFVDVVVNVTPIPMNHSGRAGELLWSDYKHVYKNTRAALATVKPEWADSDVYSAHIDKCGEEAKESKTNLLWYSVYGRKPGANNEN